jgi:MFS family permease
MSFTVGAMAAVGNIFGGLIVDRLARRDVRWFALAPACFVMIIGVLQAGADLVPTVGLAILMLAAWSLVNGFVFGPVAATVQGLVLPRMRGITGSCISFLVNVVGSGIGAVVVGLISDKLALRSGPHSIQIALACVAFVQVWGFFHLMLASRTIRADFVRVDELTRL